MAEWGSEPNWTPFEEINGGQQFSKQFGAQDLNALAENIAYLYKNRPEEDTTAIASDVVEEKTFYSEGKKQTGTMPMLRSLGGNAISIVANTNPTAPNGTLDIYVLSDHKTYVPESVGDGSYAAQIVEPNAVPENIAEGITLFGIQGTHKGGTTTPTQEKSVTVTENGTTEVVADEGYAMSKVTVIANVPIPETPIFDGTINIEPGNTTISGSYLIDESKAASLLTSLSGVKTYNVSFSAGGSGSGMGDSIDFTSMTFDATSGLILYDDKGAFAINGGFAEYNNNYGDGNGARVNFAEGTECRKEFKELFLSIADEYTEPVDDSIVGTWVFNDNVVAPDGRLFLAYSDALNNDDIGKISYYYNNEFHEYGICLGSLSSATSRYYGVQMLKQDDLFYLMISTRSAPSNPTIYLNNSLYNDFTLTFYESQLFKSDENALAWLQTNATKQVNGSSSGSGN